MLTSEGFRDGLRFIFRKGMPVLWRLDCRLGRERDSGKTGDYFELFVEEMYAA